MIKAITIAAMLSMAFAETGTQSMCRHMMGYYSNDVCTQFSSLAELQFLVLATSSFESTTDCFEDESGKPVKMGECEVVENEFIKYYGKVK